MVGHIGLLAISCGLLAIGYWQWALVCLVPIVLFVLGIFCESLCKNKSVKIALLSIVAAYMQLFGYGTGFLGECITHKARKKSQEELYK